VPTQTQNTFAGTCTVLLSNQCTSTWVAASIIIIIRLKSKALLAPHFGRLCFSSAFSLAWLLLFSDLIYSWRIYEHSDFSQHLHLPPQESPPATSDIQHPTSSNLDKDVKGKLLHQEPNSSFELPYSL